MNRGQDLYTDDLENVWEPQETSPNTCSVSRPLFEGGLDQAFLLNLMLTKRCFRVHGTQDSETRPEEGGVQPGVDHIRVYGVLRSFHVRRDDSGQEAEELCHHHLA